MTPPLMTEAAATSQTGRLRSMPGENIRVLLNLKISSSSARPKSPTPKIPLLFTVNF